MMAPQEVRLPALSGSASAGAVGAKPGLGGGEVLRSSSDADLRTAPKAGMITVDASAATNGARMNMNHSRGEVPW